MTERAAEERRVYSYCLKQRKEASNDWQGERLKREKCILIAQNKGKRPVMIGRESC